MATILYRPNHIMVYSYIHFGNYGEGIVGVYSDVRYQGVFAMGDDGDKTESETPLHSEPDMVGAGMGQESTITPEPFN